MAGLKVVSAVVANRKTAHQMSFEDFVRIYMLCESTKEVAERAGITTTTVCNKRRALREAGIDLPKFKHKSKGRKKQEINVDKLKKLVKSLS